MLDVLGCNISIVGCTIIASHRPHTCYLQHPQIRQVRLRSFQHVSSGWEEAQPSRHHWRLLLPVQPAGPGLTFYREISALHRHVSMAVITFAAAPQPMLEAETKLEKGRSNHNRVYPFNGGSVCKARRLGSWPVWRPIVLGQATYQSASPCCS